MTSDVGVDGNVVYRQLICTFLIIPLFPSIVKSFTKKTLMKNWTVKLKILVYF